MPGEALNREQQAAVDHREGPLAVLAGPGTGKTRVITHRVARIIEDGVEASSIVALTFTNKAAEQLRERLAALVGARTAAEVQASTFHGYGLGLIRRFRDLLGLAAEPTLIDGPRVRKILRDLAVRHGLYPELAAVGRAGGADAAQDDIDTLTGNGTFPDEAAAHAAAWKARLAGDGHGLDADALAAARFRAERFAQNAELYRLFGEHCAKHALMTFDDLILAAIRLLRTSPMAASHVRNQARHVVVDEFQDVNAAQIQLLALMCPPAGRPDLCVVGDDDQSIYEFRGADDRAFAKFEKTWGPCTRIALSRNYRSGAEIVSLANEVMARAETRFAPDKVVEPAGDRGEVLGVIVPEDALNGQTIAAMILSERAAGKAWRASAVIGPTHAELARIGDALELEGIPVRRARGPDALEEPGVRDLLAWVELLIRPVGSPDALLATIRLLRRAPYAVPGPRLAELAREYRESRPDDGGFLPWLLARRDEVGRAARELSAMRDRLHEATAGRPAHEALFAILRTADLTHTELLSGRERAARVSSLVLLLNFIRENAEALEPPGDLRSLPAFLEDLTEMERQLGSGTRERVEGADEPGDDADAVLLITAHSAKGLEFDTVYVPRVRPGGFPGKQRPEGEELPPGLIDRAGDDRTGRQRRAAEQRRLFYVACTRAQRRLVLLAKNKKSITDTVDYFDELTRLRQGEPLLAVLQAAEVAARAAQAGVRLAATGTLAAARVRPEDVLDEARRGARQAAAQALDSVDRPDTTPEMLRTAADALRDAAERAAATAAVRATGEAPAWAQGALKEYAQRLATAARKGPDDPVAVLAGPAPGALDLSFTHIQQYHDCARCYFAKYILGLKEPEGSRQVVGQVVHAALAEFNRGLIAAESEGRTHPTLEDLLRAARETFEHKQGGDAGQLEQVLAQLKLWHEKLHDAACEIETVEQFTELDYPRTPKGADKPVIHRLTVRIDRLDRMPGSGNGHRIVDYKTGYAKKDYLEPKATDLQLGIYAMAVSAHQRGVRCGDGGADVLAPAKGFAEYHVLSTGERGRIDLATINYAKLKEKIDAAVDGIMKGEFPQKTGCDGVCTLI